MKEPTWAEREAIFVKMRGMGYGRREIKERLSESAGIGENYVDKLMIGPQAKNHKRCAYAIYRCWCIDYLGFDPGRK